jgi:hypothetical protein
MSDPNQSMIDNLASRTGRSLAEWFEVLDSTTLEKHTELVNHLKQQHGVSHGFANGIVLAYRERGSSRSEDELADAQYAGAKAALRPVYEAILAAATALGGDVTVAPKRTAVSLRRSKQFAVVEAASAKRVQLGIQLKGAEETPRLLKGNAMCSHRVNLSRADEVDDELVGWLRAAYERA